MHQGKCALEYFQHMGINMSVFTTGYGVKRWQSSHTGQSREAEQTSLRFSHSVRLTGVHGAREANTPPPQNEATTMHPLLSKVKQQDKKNQKVFDIFQFLPPDRVTRQRKLFCSCVWFFPSDKIKRSVRD